MYRPSASLGPQASALLAASARWGAGAAGKEQIPVPVCKRKYQPFRESSKKPRSSGGIGGSSKSNSSVHEEDIDGIGRNEISGGGWREQMYGCHLHHGKRKALIERGGLRQGWEDFGQWHHYYHHKQQQQQVGSTITSRDQVHPSFHGVPGSPAAVMAATPARAPAPAPAVGTGGSGGEEAVTSEGAMTVDDQVEVQAISANRHRSRSSSSAGHGRRHKKERREAETGEAVGCGISPAESADKVDGGGDAGPAVVVQPR